LKLNHQALENHSSAEFEIFFGQILDSAKKLAEDQKINDLYQSSLKPEQNPALVYQGTPQRGDADISARKNYTGNPKDSGIEGFASNLSEEQIVEFLLAVNAANMPTNSFVGAAAALQKRMIKIELEIPASTILVDVCGTGGDNLGTLNISTAVAFVLASCGVKIAKHGNRAISSRSGSADIFSELKIGFESDSCRISNLLISHNLCFLFAPIFHQSLKNLAPIRKKLAVPTIFNFLGPVLNPLNAKMQLIGTSKPDSMNKIANVFAANPNKTAYIVSGCDGMDEITLTGFTELVICKDGKIEQQPKIKPQEFGFELVKPEELKGGDAKYNCKRLINLFSGEKSAYRDVVLLNCAFALKMAEICDSVEEGIRFARNAIDQKLALAKLLELQKIYQSKF